MTETSFLHGKLCILSCYGFHREIAAAIAAEGWDDVTVASFPVRCGRFPITWDELRPLADEACTQVVVLGSACLGELGDASCLAVSSFAASRTMFSYCGRCHPGS